MTLNDGEVQTVLNALQIAAEACMADARQADIYHRAMFQQSAQQYRALAERIEQAEEDIGL